MTELIWDEREIRKKKKKGVRDFEKTVVRGGRREEVKLGLGLLWGG